MYDRLLHNSCTPSTLRSILDHWACFAFFCRFFPSVLVYTFWFFFLRWSSALLLPMLLFHSKCGSLHVCFSLYLMIQWNILVCCVGVLENISRIFVHNVLNPIDCYMICTSDTNPTYITSLKFRPVSNWTKSCAENWIRFACLILTEHFLWCVSWFSRSPYTIISCCGNHFFLPSRVFDLYIIYLA